MAAMEPTALEIVVPDRPEKADRDAIVTALVAFNDSRAGPAGFKDVAILLRTPSGETVGGLWAKFVYDWMYVELLFVPQAARGTGLGSQLLKKAEELAIAQGCAGVWLDTFGFQARGFYERNGYSIFGTLDDHPRGTQRFFLRKILNAGTAPPGQN
jgi:GNAT superfamily N-acetyltransferase